MGSHICLFQRLDDSVDDNTKVLLRPWPELDIDACSLSATASLQEAVPFGWGLDARKKPRAFP
jgi:hypothetical protein